MPQFILKIDLGNDAMREGWQIRDALQNVAKQIDGVHTDYMAKVPTQKIRANNGNVIGHYEVRES